MTKGLSRRCLSGSVAAEEEHTRIPRRDKYSYPGCPGAAWGTPAQRRHRAGHLEEPSRQPLQRLLQLQRWSRTLQGNPGRSVSAVLKESAEAKKRWPDKKKKKAKILVATVVGGQKASSQEPLLVSSFPPRSNFG